MTQAEISPLHEAQLDAARGAAALVVTLCHFLEIYWAPTLGISGWIAHGVSTVSQHAVMVFFLLSGYLICSNIRRNIARHGQFSVMEYWSGRVARIYPPLLLSVALCALIQFTLSYWALPGSSSHPFTQIGRGVVVEAVVELKPGELWRTLLMLGTPSALNTPLWSLFIEIRLYLLAGLLAMATSPGWRRWLALLAAAMVAAFAFDLHDPRIPANMLIWGGGALLTLPKTAALRRRVLLIAALAGMLVLTSMAVMEPILLSVLYAGGPHGSSWLIVLLAMLAFAPFYALLVFAVPLPSKVVHALDRIAPWSYSLYLLNWPILLFGMVLARDWMGLDVSRTLLVSLLAMLVAMAAAIVTAKWTERPALYRRWLLDTLAQHMPGITKRESKAT